MMCPCGGGWLVSSYMLTERTCLLFLPWRSALQLWNTAESLTLPGITEGHDHLLSHQQGPTADPLPQPKWWGSMSQPSLVHFVRSIIKSSIASSVRVWYNLVLLLQGHAQTCWADHLLSADSHLCPTRRPSVPEIFLWEWRINAYETLSSHLHPKCRLSRYANHTILYIKCCWNQIKRHVVIEQLWY